MKMGKSVEEVWAWRKALEKELENVPEKKQIKYLNEKAKAGCRKLGIKYRAVKREHARS